MSFTLHEETLMVSEIHHRMTNGFQLLQAFARQQLRECETEEAQDRVGRVLRQIESVSSLQKALTQASLGKFCAFIEEIEPHLQHLGKGQDVEISMRHDAPRHLPIHVSDNAARILMEAITNALEHAFPAKTGGRIEVEVMTEDGVRMHMRVADNGVGLQTTPGDGQGTGIIAALARELDGEARWEPGQSGGCTLSVTFPVTPDYGMAQGNGVHMTS